MFHQSRNLPIANKNPPRGGLTAMEIAVIAIIIIILIVLLLPGVSSHPVAPSALCKNNLKHLGVALHNYHQEYGSYPPAYVIDDEGKPLYSWRVLILPFLDRQGLYNAYRLDEPWDSPHNLTLLDVDVPVFHCPFDEEWVKGAGTGEIRGMTSYLAVIGPETVWPMPNACTLDDITDDRTKTIHIVEVSNSGIKWSEPRDLHVTQMAREINPKGGMGLSSQHPGGTHVLMVDGSEGHLPDTTPPKTLRALLTRAGREEMTD